MNFTLLEAEEYYKALLKETPRAKRRIVLAAMIVLWGEQTAPIFDMLQAAVQRGVKVTILLDNFTRLTYLHHLRSDASGSERLRRTFRALEELSAQGAKVCSFGKLGMPPQKGRCHIKVAVFDDTTYSFGGVNFFDEMFDTIDYMLASKSAKLADCMTELVERICSTRPPMNDGEVELDKTSSILFDGGVRGSSIIYNRACELTAQAKRVYFLGLLVPSGQLAKLCAETNTTIYSNRVEQLGPLESIAQSFDQQKYHITNAYKGDRFIHAKYMLFELPGGRKALLSGSHNFSYRGVSYGTQEIALHSTDTALWQVFRAHLKKSVAQKPVK